MGTIIERARKGGSKAFSAQIVIKKDGVIVRREAQTFDRKPAANACCSYEGRVIRWRRSTNFGRFAEGLVSLQR